jgi:hypothetical protein
MQHLKENRFINELSIYKIKKLKNKPVVKRRLGLIELVRFILLLLIPIYSNAQSKREVKNFNNSFTFTNTYTINMETNTHSKNISGFISIAKFRIDKNGNGKIDFKTLQTEGEISTIVYVDYSQIKIFNQITYWNFSCTHSERPEKIQMTLEIEPEANTIKSFVIYDEKQKKAYVFY